MQQAIVRFPLKAREGKSREETSIILGIGLETVKTHAKSILQKLAKSHPDMPAVHVF